MIKLFFCKFFQFSKYIGNATSDDPYAFKAMGILTFFLSLNAFTIIGYYKALIEHSASILISTFLEILIILSIGCINYFFLLKDKKYESIYENFEKNPKISGRRGTWLTIFYMIATITIMSGLIWVGRMNIKGF